MASIVLVDDEQNFLLATSELLRAQGHSVVTADSLATARKVLAQQPCDQLLIDLMLPDGNGLELLDELGSARPRQVVIITGHPSIKSTIHLLHGPGLRYLTKPIDIKELLSLSALLDTDDQATAGATYHFGLLVGDSAPMQRVYEDIRQVAMASDTAVLISGATGTGKELIAEAIHKQSGRSGDFVPVNCGALSKELIASELFGHEKGSFTGANKRHIGMFERAEGGTLFLDEITEMPIDQQPHLLRALETRRITRVGGEQEIAYEARIICATNRNLAEAIEANILREDLYFRLSIFPIELPSLSERPEDIAPLANAFLQQLNCKHGMRKILSADALARLQAWHWPGNLRELKHTIHRSFVSTVGNTAELRIPDRFAGDLLGAKATSLSPGRSIQDVEQELILRTLKHYGGDKKAAAETLGISLKTLYNRLESYELEV